MSAPRRSQAERREETERRVLEAATRLIAASGSQNLTLRAVGLEAGYSRGIVNHQFGSKEALLRAVINRAQDAFALPATDATGLDLLTLTVEKYVDYLSERGPTGQAFLVLWAEAVGSDASLRSMFAERDAWFREVLAEHVAHGIAEGTIRADANPTAVAVTVLGMLRGIGLQMLLTPELPSLQAIRDEATQTIWTGLAAAADRRQSSDSSSQTSGRLRPRSIPMV